MALKKFVCKPLYKEHNNKGPLQLCYAILGNHYCYLHIWKYGNLKTLNIRQIYDSNLVHLNIYQMNYCFVLITFKIFAVLRNTCFSSTYFLFYLFFLIFLFCMWFIHSFVFGFRYKFFLHTVLSSTSDASGIMKMTKSIILVTWGLPRKN